MKKMMIFGGLLGFLLGMGFSIASQEEWLGIFWKACVAAYLVGLMMRWWARVWVRCLKDAFKEKLKREDVASGLPNELKEKET
jgi:hypothetical protein